MTRPALLGALLILSLLAGCDDASGDPSGDTAPAPTATAVQPTDPVPVTPASGGALEGHYEGTIDYQGYEIGFDVVAGQVQDLVGRVLVDCGSGSTDLTIAPSQPFAVGADGSVAQTVTDDFDGSQAEVELNGTFSGGTFTGYVREVDTVDGTGSGCDTLQRTFTATLQ